MIAQEPQRENMYYERAQVSQMSDRLGDILYGRVYFHRADLRREKLLSDFGFKELKGDLVNPFETITAESKKWRPGNTDEFTEARAEYLLTLARFKAKSRLCQATEATIREDEAFRVPNPDLNKLFYAKYLVACRGLILDEQQRLLQENPLTNSRVLLARNKYLNTWLESTNTPRSLDVYLVQDLIDLKR